MKFFIGELVLEDHYNVIFLVAILASFLLAVYLIVSSSSISLSKLSISSLEKHVDLESWGIGSLAKVLEDFRHKRYYNPFRRGRPVVIHQPEAMTELSEAAALSQRAVYADIFGFQFTLSDTETQWDPNSQIAARYRLFARAIRINGLAQISTLQPYLQKRVQRTSKELIDAQISCEEWQPIQIAPIMRDLATGMLSVYFFGEQLTSEPEFYSALQQYYTDTMKCMAILPMVPSVLKSTAYSIITKKGRALSILLKRLLSTVDPQHGVWHENGGLRSHTLLQNMMEASKESTYWTPQLVIQALIGIWFAASHQPWINLQFVFLELCNRPSYVSEIRKELAMKGDDLDYEDIISLPILDSFIKESVRLNPLDKMGVRRKALKPYTFVHGGAHVSLGQIACVPAWDLMHNESKYPYPNEFDGFRFVKNPTTTGVLGSTKGLDMRGTTFTDGSKDFPIWGLGSKMCPGRWHSSLIIKMALLHLVKNYNFRIEGGIDQHRWFWESFQMPYESSEVLMQKRAF